MNTPSRCLWGGCLIALWLCGCPSPGDDMDGGRLPDGGTDALVIDSGEDANTEAADITFYRHDGGLQCGTIDAGTTDATKAPGPQRPPGFDTPRVYRGSATIMDFNGDGLFDVPACTDGQHNLTIRWGQPDGTFRDEVQPGYTDCWNINSIEDFNHDGRLDLLVIGGATDSLNPIPENVTVALNQGNGFTPGQKIVVAPGNPSRTMLANPRAADFNGDGLLDVYYSIGDVALTQAIQNAYVVVRLAMIESNGAFGFGEPIYTPVSFVGGDIRGGNYYNFKAADYNHDGFADLVSAMKVSGDAYWADGGIGYIDRVQIFQGVGDGTFIDGQSFPGHCAAWGDVNGDGSLDLVHGCQYSNRNAVFTAFGDGAGHFDRDKEIDLGSNWSFHDFSIADVNEDGKMDLVSVSSAIALGHGDGTFDAPRLAGTASDCRPAGDIDHDGHVDLVSGSNDSLFYGAGYDVFMFYSDVAAVRFGHGDGTFEHPPLPVQSSGSLIASGDFNGDCKRDFMTLGDAWNPEDSQHRLHIFWGDGRGQFPAKTTLPDTIYNGKSLLAGDLNGDGLSDYVASWYDPVSVTAGIQWGINDGHGGFVAAGRLDSAVVQQIVDADGDGIPDIVGTGYWENDITEIGFLKPDGTLDEVVVLDQGTLLLAALAVADLNGDGLPDIVVDSYYGAAYVFINQGGRRYLKTQEILLWAGIEPNSVALGDLDGDGNVDAFITGSLFYGDGTGTLNFGSELSDAYKPIALADINADGRLDAVLFTEWGLNVAFNQGARQFSQLRGHLGTDGYARGWILDDFDNDGKPDLIIADDFGHYSVVHNGY